MKIQPGLPSVPRVRQGLSGFEGSCDGVDLGLTRPTTELDRAAALAACANFPGISRDATFQAHFDHKQGWLGADGAYSLPFSDGRVLWLFSDTITGSIGEDGDLQPGWGMIHNSWGCQAGPQAPMVPTPQPLFPGQDEKSWYWVYAGRATGPNQAQVLLGSFTTCSGPDGFNFRQNGAALARLRMGEPPEVESITPLPHFREGPPPTNWGAGLVEHEGNLYVYGSRDHGSSKEIVVARTPRLEDFSAWTFWNGHEWSSEPDEAAPLGPSVANELSVSHRAGKFEMITQVGNEIWSHRGVQPSGPFEGQLVYRIPSDDPGVLTYNAKLHPHLNNEQGMLLTYNQNVYPVERLQHDPELYRPQCLRYQPSN